MILEFLVYCAEQEAPRRVVVKVANQFDQRPSVQSNSNFLRGKRDAAAVEATEQAVDGIAAVLASGLDYNSLDEGVVEAPLAFGRKGRVAGALEGSATSRSTKGRPSS